MSKLLEASSRVAFAGLIHDIGKFLQRTKYLPVSEGDKQLYCSNTEYGFSHIHAAYTAAAIDELENLFPLLKCENIYPFKGINEKDIDDSLINAAAQHHKPKTALQTIITVADRLSSAFERLEYETYTKQNDNENYITARMTSIFEELDKETFNQSDFQYIYPLKELSPTSCFPCLQTKISQEEASNEYKTLWDNFKKDLKNIPQESQKSWKQWLDHFDSLWLTYTQAIPSASAFISGKNTNKTMSNVSLYDHSKSTAALATALWQFYENENISDREMMLRLKTDQDVPFLIIQGDISGIQNFIFSQEKHEDASKLLRGRSFFVSLLCECAALKILETLGLPSTSQIINAAGHFMIVAANTSETIQKLNLVKDEIEEWFYNELYGTSNISLSWKEASQKDFEATKFKEFCSKLHLELEKSKLSQMDLCNGKYSPIFYNFLTSCSDICSADGRFPRDSQTGENLCSLCADIKEIGKRLTSSHYIIIGKDVEKPLNTKIFGYQIQLSEKAPYLNLDKYIRIWDISMPNDLDKPFFNGYARRNINAYVPKDRDGNVLSFEDIVNDTEGKSALMSLKGDIDNLGFLFSDRIKHLTFASYAGLSRRINAFFTTVLPAYCQQKYTDIYTVFAGGDDFFFIAPWHKQIEFLKDLKQLFDSYVCSNLTFSAGLVMSNVNMPVRILADLTEEKLEKAKSLDNKNGVCCFDQTMDFNVFFDLLKIEKSLTFNKHQYRLSTGYIYRLISLCEKAESAKKHPEDAIWRSWLSYRTVRHLDTLKLSDEDFNIGLSDLSMLFGKGIETYTEKFKLPLFIHLYKLREKEV